MSSRIRVMPDSLDWKQAYRAAVFEKDRARIPGLIADAKEKLALRLRELRARGFVLCDEIEAIHDASYMLQALHSSLTYKDEFNGPAPERRSRSSSQKPSRTG